MDPLLHDTTDERFVLFPIKNDQVWSLYKKSVDSFWRAEEVDLSKDLNDWKSLSNDERYFILHILAFFAGSDGIVAENLAERFMRDVKLPEARCFYGFQIAMENIHSETYSLLIDTFASSPQEKRQLFKAISTYPAIAQKADWCKKYIESNKHFCERLIAFICVEGIFFSGSFCAIFWLKKRGKLPGLTFSNEFISRDEALHMEFGVLLHSLLREKCHPAIIANIVKEAVDIEKEFITESLPCKLIGMNSKLMIQYIEYVADYILGLLHCPKLYNSPNPFDFMEMISIESKTNFFEKRVSEYALANIEKNESVFDLNSDF
jgi:ribonucleotide reductase beta subunit family protein with ferritin-like domain